MEIKSKDRRKKSGFYFAVSKQMYFTIPSDEV